MFNSTNKSEYGNAINSFVIQQLHKINGSSSGPTGPKGTNGSKGSTGYTGYTGPAGESSDIPTKTSEPTGHLNKAQSNISFDYTTRTFSISPVGTYFEVWVAGTKYTKSTTLTTIIPNVSGLYYIYFDSSGNLGNQTSFFIWDQQAPTAYIYYNSSQPSEYMFFDERHGITMDWATHEYLHRTRGAVLASGFSIYGYTTTGLGTLDSDAQFSVANGTFFDEDQQIDIANGLPAVDFTMQIQNPATLPTLYRDGTSWRKTSTNIFACTFGINGRINYNLISSGNGTIVESSNNRYVIQWIIATNMIKTPMCAIMGQNQYTALNNAQNEIWDNLYLTGFPIVELRPLYKIIFEVKNTFSNSAKARIVYIEDIRQMSSSIGVGVPAQIGPTGPTGPTGTTKISQFVNAGITVNLNNLNIRIPSSGNTSLQVSTVSGTYSVYGSGMYIANGVNGGNSIDSSSPLSISTTYAYIYSSNNFLNGGDVSIWHLMDTTSQKAWKISCIIGSSFNNNLISIEELI